MTPFEQCLKTLSDLAAADDPKGLESVERHVQAYLALPDSPQGVSHPCDDLAEALMKSVPDTEIKGHILDKLFQIERRSDNEAPIGT